MGWFDRLLGKAAKQKSVKQPPEARTAEQVRFLISERIFPMLLAGLETMPDLGELRQRIAEAQHVYEGYEFILPRREAQQLYNTVVDVHDRHLQEAKERLRAPIEAVSPMQMREHSQALFSQVRDWQEVVQAIISQVPRDLRPQSPPPEVWD